MVDIRKFNDDVSVSPQIAAADLDQIHALGFRSIICNRPDDEAMDQPAFAEIEEAARAKGIEVLYQPVVSGRVSSQDGVAFGQALADLPGPVLAYCRSGTRCAMLWTWANKDRMEPDEIIRTARAAGYDMSPLLRN